MTEIPKQSLQSLDIKEQQLQKLKQIFPEVFTEANNIDFDRLRLTLGQNIDTHKERYGLTWQGKADCFMTIQQPTTATLVPQPEQSLDFDNTQNLFIEGDNLETLKLLQKSYLGKVKMIYIDPPYNTGNDFIYPDNYTDSLQTYLQYTGQANADGKRFGSNTDTNGRFHTNWLNMMYPRLFLAKNLLREDGVIFISIDDNEQANLKHLCNEIFGEENFVGQISWIKKTKPINSGDAKYQLQSKLEYILCYCKVKRSTYKFNLKVIGKREYNFDGKLGKCRLKDILDSDIGMKKRDTMKFPILGIYPPDGQRWKIGKQEIENLIQKNKVEIVDGKIKIAIYPEEEDGIKLQPFWSFLENVGTAENGKSELNELFGNPLGFDTVKPTDLLRALMELSTNCTSSDLILDFFAGSATTAHAVMELNKEDGGNRRYICVQLPHPTEPNTEAHKAGYPTIAHIARERIRRVAAKIQAEQNTQQTGLFTDALPATLDLGFRAFALAPSNFRIWDGTLETDPELLQQKIFDHIHHIDPKAAQLALLFELLLKSGYALSSPIQQLTLANKTVFSLAEGALLICLEKELTLDCIKAIAEQHPSKVICLDEAFVGQNADALKTNAVQIMKNKGVINFRTV